MGSPPVVTDVLVLTPSRIAVTVIACVALETLVGAAKVNRKVTSSPDEYFTVLSATRFR